MMASPLPGACDGVTDAMTGGSYEKSVLIIERCGPSATRTSRLAPTPTGARHWTRVRLTHSVLVQLRPPTVIERSEGGEGAESPKFSPSIVRTQRDVTGQLCGEMASTTGPSKTSAVSAAPCCPATFTVMCARPAPGGAVQLTAPFDIQRTGAHGSATTRTVIACRAAPKPEPLTQEEAQLEEEEEEEGLFKANAVN